MRVIIAGSRDFSDYELMDAFLRKLGVHRIDCTIVSGGARGADKLGERWASNYGKPVKVFPAQWNKFGKSAGYRRNVEMAEYATHLVAFWDGASKGTNHMINIAERYGVETRIIKFEDVYPKPVPPKRTGL